MNKKFIIFLAAVLVYSSAQTTTQSNEVNVISVNVIKDRNLILQIQIPDTVNPRNFILGWGTSPTAPQQHTLDDMMNSPGQYDLDSFFDQSLIAKLFIPSSKLNNINKIYAYIIRSDLNDGVASYSYIFDVQQLNQQNCWCNSSQKCTCKSHGVIECKNGFVGYNCETSAIQLQLVQQTYKIQKVQFFYFDVNSVDDEFTLSVTSQNQFDFYVKYYTVNGAVLPNSQTSQFHSNQVKQAAANIQYREETSKESGLPNTHRVLVKIVNSNPPLSIDVMTSLVETSSSEEIFIILIVIASLFLIILILSLIYIMKLQKRDRVQSEQQRAERMEQRSQQLNTGRVVTMGDEDIQKYMPSVQYQVVKSNLVKVSQQQDTGSCVVCLCEFEDDELVRSTFCKHLFHSSCLTDWMKKNESCPYCREALTRENVAEQYEKFQSNSLIWLTSQKDKQNENKLSDRIENKKDDLEKQNGEQGQGTENKQNEQSRIIPDIENNDSLANSNMKMIELTQMKIGTPVNQIKVNGGSDSPTTDQVIGEKGQAKNSQSDQKSAFQNNYLSDITGSIVQSSRSIDTANSPFNSDLKPEEANINFTEGADKEQNDQYSSATVLPNRRKSNKPSQFMKKKNQQQLQQQLSDELLEKSG